MTKKESNRINSFKKHTPEMIRILFKVSRDADNFLKAVKGDPTNKFGVFRTKKQIDGYNRAVKKAALALVDVGGLSTTIILRLIQELND